MPSVIALDAMGSDKAPKPEIEGALQAARHHGVRVLLVGPQDRLKAELARYPGARRLPVEVVHASEVITMEDKVEAIRAKRDSSIRVGLRLVREGRAAGFVTAGNTGAAMATAKVVLGALPGVDRPALAAAFPTVLNTAAVLLDVGANVDCTAQNLEQFIFPAIAISFFTMAVVMRLLRATMLEVLGLDYVRTARAKGVPRRRVIVDFKVSLSTARTSRATPSEVFSATLPTNPSATITSTCPL